MLNHQDRLFDLLDGMEMTKSEHDWLELRFANMTEKERLLEDFCSPARWNWSARRKLTV